MKTPLAAAVMALITVPSMGGTYSYHHENVLGTSMELVVQADDEASADAAEARTLAEVDRLAGVLSTYRSDSEISRWLAGKHGAATVSTDLFAVLSACDRWEADSRGAFNPRVEALTQIWKQSASTQMLPAQEVLAAAVQRINEPAWKLSDGSRAERLSDCPVTVSALAKGYIIQMAGGKAWDPAQGVSGVLLNIGGDLQTWGGGTHTVTIADPAADAENAAPLTAVGLHQQAMATSGDYRRGTNIAGRHHSHIIDPRTGQPAEHILSASVIAPDATTADALATIFSVLAPRESLRMADAMPGVACLLVTDAAVLRSRAWSDLPHGGWSPVQTPAAPASATPLVAERSWKSAEGKSMEAAVISLTGEIVKFRLKAGGEVDYPLSKLSAEDQKLIHDAAAAAAADWGKSHELLVKYEINTPGGGRGRRPYVAIWVEDKDGFPVRTLTLLMQAGKGLKYLPDLKKWSRSEKLRKISEGTDIVASVSSATRNPGEYSALWDGMDNAGAAVKPGTYTLYIEAAREHGTYQLMKHEITVGGAAVAAEKLDGNEEIKSATVEYREKTAK